MRVPSLVKSSYRHLAFARFPHDDNPCRLNRSMQHHFLLARHGGIAPAARRRSPRVLTLAEREDISRGIAGGASLRQIAKRLSRAASTISREVARHGGRAPYRANRADQQAWAICCAGRATATGPRGWSVIRASACW